MSPPDSRSRHAHAFASLMGSRSSLCRYQHHPGPPCVLQYRAIYESFTLDGKRICMSSSMFFMRGAVLGIHARRAKAHAGAVSTESSLAEANFFSRIIRLLRTTEEELH